MSELKPCPFCGADNGYVDVISNPFSNDIYSRGHCIKCHSVGTFYAQSYLEGELRPSFEQMAQMATEQWNTRPIEDALRKRIAELEAERRWIPVSERLPDTKIVYDKFDVIVELVDIGNGEMIRRVDLLSYDYRNKSWNDDCGEFGFYPVTGITHWRERPTPPEVQE